MQTFYPISKETLIGFIVKNKPSIRKKDLTGLRTEDLLIIKVQLEIDLSKKCELKH